MTEIKQAKDAGVPILTVGARCRFEHIPKNLQSALKKELTIANPKYLDAKKYGRWMGKRLKPYLYFFDEDARGIDFPRGFARKAIVICRQFLDITPEIIDIRKLLPEVDYDFKGSLRPYQEEALAAIIKRDFGVLESGTGSGKTVIGLAAIAHRRQPALIIVHTKELLYQWADRIEEFLGINPGLIGDGKYEIKPVTVAIVNSARKNLAELSPLFGYLCVDECHRVPATLFTEVVTAFDCQYSLGLSATAFRRDGLTNLINFYLGDTCHRVDANKLHKSGAVLRPEFIQRNTEFKFTYRGSYQDLMSSLTANEARNFLIVDDIYKEARREPGTVLVVSDRVAHCNEIGEFLAEKCQEQGQDLKTAVLTGKLPTEERSAIVDRIRNGDLNVLISTVQLIGEGFDCEGLRALFLTTPIKFSGRLMQVVGRILRPAAGKQPKVFDYVDPVGVLKKSALSRRLTYEGNLQDL